MLLCYILSIVILFIPSSSGKICTSVRIHNQADSLKKLENCTVVEGNVKIVLMQITNHTHFEPYSFPKLREITEFLLIYDVTGLRSLGKLFPNLERIGGERLIQVSALIIAQVINLEEIGLYSLREISKGSVIVMRNPRLCYLDTIDWKHILKWDAAKTHFYMNADSPSMCPACPKTCTEGFCWNSTLCHEIRESESNCHHLCLGDCRGPTARDCYVCKGLRDGDGTCVESCPPNTFKLHRKCVTQDECNQFEYPFGFVSYEKYRYVTHEDNCIEFLNCPEGYMLSFDHTACVQCENDTCEKACYGRSITSVEDAHKFKGCTFILNSMSIKLRHEFTRTVHRELEDCLGSIKRINGYLKVTRSTVTDLKFFKKLQVINGNDSSYALYVVDNQNLVELWDWTTKNHSFSINNKVFFHYNPKLCLQHIYKLLEVSKYVTTHSESEIGKESNGEEFPCNTLKVNITVISKSFDVIKIHIPFLRVHNAEPSHYLVNYAEDTFKNLTIFDQFDSCSSNSWKTIDIPIYSMDNESTFQGFYVDLIKLKPYTNYVCYFTVLIGNRVEAKSEFQYIYTLPSKPTELTRIQASSNSSSEIHLEWDPPKHVNGRLKEYVVTWVELRDDSLLRDRRNYCQNPMDYSIRPNSFEIEKPKPKNFSCESVCVKQNEPKYKPKEGFEYLCKNFKKANLPNWFSERSRDLSSCESYFYSYIGKRPFNFTENDTDFGFKKLSNKNKYGLNLLTQEELYFFKTKNFSRNSSITKNFAEEGIKIVPGNSSGTILSGLKHFSNYVVTVRACRESSPEELNPSEEVRCSNKDFLTIRTNKIILADNITSLNYSVFEKSLILEWKVPIKPNGLVLSFEMELQPKNRGTPKKILECLSYTNKESDTVKRSIDNLPIGKHEFRIRAVTLSGKGPFTPFYPFEVFDNETYSVFELIVLAISTLVVLLSIAVFAGFFTKKNYTAIDNVLFAEVNPNYHYTPDPLYEVSRDRIEFGNEIGVGSFGKVFTGLIKPENKPCAIKTMNAEYTSQVEIEFLREATLMKSLRRANYVVKLLGVVSKDGPPLVLMELMELGDLKSYLRLTRDTQLLGNATMIRWAIEIGDAMTFMEAQKFVHRDLAARNCMVGADLTVKVGDFGMARDIYETDYYRKTNQGLLPIRWMAPESLRDGEFTSFSDVWSYGVVLWEIVTKAEQPYQGLSNDQVLLEVIAGARLDIPLHCHEILKKIMTRCWRSESLARANFMQIMYSLHYYHKDDEEFKKLSYFYTPEAAEKRDPKNPKYVEMRAVDESLFQAVEL